MEQIPLIAATRLSALAQKQTQIACQAIAQIEPHVSCTLLGIQTQGDLNLTSPLKDLGGKGVFVKELQQALLDGRADLAVHSMKDMPITQVDGLAIIGLYAASSSPWDVCVSSFGHWRNLPQGAKIGTSSLRRAVQFSKLRPDCHIVPIRGNVLTRLDRLKSGNFDALILAEAGLQRLELDCPCTRFSLQEMVPAFNQGILGIESRVDHVALKEIMTSFTPRELQIRVLWERSIAQALGASCKSAIGIYANVLSIDPLRVSLSLFACKDWEHTLSLSGEFSDLKSAQHWVSAHCHGDPESWAICQIAFT